jgi:hypothetical protein
MSSVASIVRLDGAVVSREMDGSAVHGQMHQIAHRGPENERFHFWVVSPIGMSGSTWSKRWSTTC